MAKQTRQNELKQRFLGTTAEPKYDSLENNSELSSALNWYQANKDKKTAMRYLADYAKKNKIKGRPDLGQNFITTAFLCRLIYNGTKLPESVLQNVEEQVKNIYSLDESIETVVEKTTPTISIQDRVNEKVSEIIGELEGSIDNYQLSGFKIEPSPYGIMHDKAKAMHASKIIEWFKRQRAQYDEVLTTTDEQLIEGYSNFSKNDIKKLVAYCDTIISDAMRITDESKAGRKPRKKKSKTPEQLVAKVQLLDESEEFGLKSEPTKNIIGATSLWVFNVKNRKLGVYHALDVQGFGVKGTSLTNFSEMKSIQKTLRKPEMILPDVVKGAKVFLRNVMENINAKDSALNGRLNKDTILIKVIK
jgi:hypothetical protein